MKICSIITKFQKLPWKKKLLHLEAFTYQFSIGLLLKFVPFRYIPKLFTAPSSLTPHASYLTSHISTIEDVKNATWSVSRFSPWENKCLVKSLAARKMLTRRGIPSQISLGVSNSQNSKIEAHAWLKSGDFEVVEKNGEYCELYLF